MYNYEYILGSGGSRSDKLIREVGTQAGQGMPSIPQGYVLADKTQINQLNVR